MTVVQDGDTALRPGAEETRVAGETAGIGRIVTGAVVALRFVRVTPAVVPGLITDAKTLGGDVLEAGPTRLLVRFAGDDAVLEACQAARHIRRTRGVSVATGVHVGGFELSIVGHRPRVIVAGPNVSCVLSLADAARPGEIVASAAAVRAFGAGSAGPPRGDGFLVRRVPPCARAGSHDVEPTCVQDVGEYVTVGVVTFTGCDDIVRGGGVGALAGRLDDVVRELQAGAERHRISLLRAEAAVDGGRIVLIATGAFDDGLLRTLEVVRRAPPGLALRGGVDHGSDSTDAFARAAWLAGEARPGETLASSRVVARLGSTYDLARLPRADGKRRRVAGYVVREAVDGRLIDPSR